MSSPETQPLLPTTTKPLARRSEAPFGYFLMVLSAFFQAATTLLFHMAEVQYAISASANLLVLGVVCLTLPLCILTATRTNSLLPALRDHPHVHGPLLLRALFGGVTTLCANLAVSYIPAGAFSTAFGLAPIFTSVFASLLFREPFTLTHAASLTVNLLGVALVSQASPAPHAASAQANAFASAHLVFGYACALSAAACAAGAALSIKRLGKSVDPVSLTAVYGLGCIALSPLFVRASDLSVLLHNHAGATCAISGAVCTCISQLFFALSLKRAPAGPAVMVRSLGVPLVFVLALVFMNERVGLSGIVGMLLTICSVLPLVLNDRVEEAPTSRKDVPTSPAYGGTQK